MRAVRLYDPGDLRVEDIDAPPPPPPGYVNLKVRAAGICGSDLHNYRTGQWISRRPSVAGHEFCGTVIETGDGVADFRPGDTVVSDSRVWCGACRQCKNGFTNACETLGFVGEVCDGGFAEAVQLPARLLHRHPPSLPARIAAMAEPLAVALHAVHKIAVPKQQPVLVAGCGTIGGLAALLLSRFHDGPILICDLNPTKAETVAALAGADIVDLDKLSVGKALDGKPLRYALDATGSVKAITALLQVLDGGGALGLVGISHGTIDLDPNQLVESETSLIGCHAFIDELPEAIALLEQMQPQLERISDAISLEEVPAAYESLIAGRGSHLKTIIEINR